MYTRIALGKNTVMDVVAGESSGSIGQLFILYPLLFSEFCTHKRIPGENPGRVDVGIFSLLRLLH